MTEWQEVQYVPFETYFEIPLRNGLTKPKRVRGEGYKMINMGEIFKYSRMKKIPMDRVPMNEKELNSSMILEGDLLFARQSLVRDGAGKCSIFLEDTEEVCFESHLIRCRLDKKKSNPLFFYYFFNSSVGKNTMDAIIEQGAGAAGIRGSDLSKLLVPNLTVNKQNLIADFLDSIDQKIELNQRMNETLEGMARAIFKSWFVDFEPVHAKAEGRPPEGMDSATAAIFPSTFTSDGLPEGWEEKPFSELINLIGGGTPKTIINEYWNGDIPWFSVVDAPNESDVFVIDTEKKITDLGVQKSSTKILQPNTTIISARGTVGRVALTGVPMAMNQSCYGITGNNLPNYYTYFCVKQLVAELKSRAHGSVFDTITRETFETISFVTPPQELAQAYDENVKELMEKILCNLKQNQTLAALRDTLLPKLISGELRVDPTTAPLKEAVG